VKDGAHTHHGSGGGGLGLVVAIGAGALLADKIAVTMIRVLPVLVTGAAVIAGLAIAGWVTRAVLLCRWQQVAICRDQLDPGRPDQLTGTVAAPDRQAQLAVDPDWPGLVSHEHLHFHGLAAGQVAAILAARQRSGGEQ
jgi:hypothetical protein